MSTGSTSLPPQRALVNEDTDQTVGGEIDLSNLRIAMAPDPRGSPGKVLLQDIWFLNNYFREFFTTNPRTLYLDVSKHPKLAKHIMRSAREQDDWQRIQSNLDEFGAHIEAIREETMNWFDPVIEARMGTLVHRQYGPIRPNWDSIDSLMPSHPDDEQRRYKADWKWEGNSCATDAVICLAVHLNAYRIRADQTAQAIVPNLGAHWLRNIARLPWGNMTATQRFQLRDHLRVAIADASTHHKFIDAYRPLQETYDFVFKGLPQVSYLVIHRRWCCDETHCEYSGFTSKSSFAVNIRQLQNKKPTISNTLKCVFEPSSRDRGDGDECKRSGKSCKVRMSEIVIVGRLPPILSVHIQEFESQSLKDPGVIEIAFKQYQADDKDSIAIGQGNDPIPLKASYRLKAVLYFINNDHYVMESALQEETTGGRLHMDMMAKQPPRVSKSKCKPGDWRVFGAKAEYLVFKLCSTSETAS